HQVTLDDGEVNDLGGNWPRISLYGSLSEACGQEITPETDIAVLKKIADKVEIEIDHPLHGKYVEELWEHFVKPGLDKPTFVMDFPVDTSPLTRDHRDQAGVVEKWDLYVRGFEQATGYSELVDPVVQRERFVK
ncbi:MAG: amino acid--tRNA ligase-related protein, partial [Aquiluna sp.]